MVYDWANPTYSDGGIAYAWADKPESPFHRAPQSILHVNPKTALLGRYDRAYGATLFRRKNDWLILAEMCRGSLRDVRDLRAASRRSRTRDRVLVRNPESNYFYPPLLEFYPAFAPRRIRLCAGLFRGHESQLHHDVPGSDRAANRFRPHGKSSATAPSGITKIRTSEGTDCGGKPFPVKSTRRERSGLCSIPSTRKAGATVNLAQRPWNKPFRDRGFVLNGNSARA